jgi:DR2241 stabilising domain/4Fe-4S iron-sulfur cluster binding domain
MKATAHFQLWLERLSSPGHIGQVTIHPDWSLTHRDDKTMSALTPVADLSAWRELLKLDVNRNFRPLRAAPNLRRGWKFGPLDLPALVLALEYLYPAALANWVLFESGQLEITDYAGTAGRQTGRFAITKTLDLAAQIELRKTICHAGCLKRPLWRTSPSADAPGIAVDSASVIPLLCPEACNYFISKARDKIKSGPEEDVFD